MALQCYPPYVFAPDFPVSDGYIKLGYLSSQTIIQSYEFILPGFICFDKHKCPSLTPMFELDNYTQVVERDVKHHCIGKEDELENNMLIDHINQLRFSALCDGRTDLFSSRNETDETNCEQWPCANQYTRCNGIWQCQKGIDEINCS
ncbi:unnamed protein product [Rotaria magnacalcarata]|uniref:Uncharacterized protein n=1 Tax=Rotaria magnacalcarata TaxID=392030 RepID=A0A8S2ME69_9BILA|nr:unnamed protein product [Rotaria magnacalcarata]